MSDTTFLKDNLTGSVPVDIATEVIKNVIEQASILKVAKKVPMTTEKRTVPILTGSGSASWVGEGEKIDTTLPTFEYPQLKACKLAVIVPVTREKINDSILNVMGEIQDAMADAFAKAIDEAMIFGINSPFETNLLAACESQKIEATASLASDITNVMGLVEDNKLNCTNLLMGSSQKKTLRGIYLDAKYNSGVIGLNTAFDTPIEFVRDWNDTKALSIAGDFTKALVGTREGIEYETLREATIVSGSETINLAQRDMIALKVTMRLGFLVADPKAFAKIVAPAG